MAWPTYTIDDLVIFTGRPEASYTDYANTAIAQAFLMFKLATCLKDWPTDDTYAELAKLAVLSLADAFYLSQAFSETMASPFQSETIGSYSYSKASKAVQTGTPTGISWFDLAVQQLGICENGGLSGGVDSGSIGVFENDATFAADSDGKKFVQGPADIYMPDVAGHFSVSDV